MNIATRKLIIARPHMGSLILENNGHPQEASVNRESERSFAAAIIGDRRRGYVYPISIKRILSNDSTHIRRINDRNQSLGEDVRLLPIHEVLRLRNWLDRGMPFCDGAVWEPDLDLD